MGSIALVKLKRTDSTGTDREQCAFLDSKGSSPRASSQSLHGGHGGSEGDSVGCFKTFCNIFISFVGAGVLGLPYAFRKSGLILGAGFLILTAVLSLHCMLMLVKCKKHLEHKNVHTYSQLTEYAFGTTAGVATNVLLTVSQVGFCVGYLVFIGQNSKSIDGLPKWEHILGCFPILAALALLRSLASLAPFSIVADVAIVLSIMVVTYHDVINTFNNPQPVEYFRSLSSLPFLFGVSMYCFEGFGMILPIEASMQHREKFPMVLSSSIGVITALFLSFSLMGYNAYGNHTEDIITLNLPHDVSVVLVKVALSLGLLLTFPVMLLPVYEILETSLLASQRFCSMVRPSIRHVAFTLVRVAVVAVTVLIAAVVPGFGIFIALVGSVVCALLAFVMPALVFNKVFADDISSTVKWTNRAIILFGLTGAVLGTLDTVQGVFLSSQPHYTDITTSLVVNSTQSADTDDSDSDTIRFKDVVEAVTNAIPMVRK